MPFINIQIKQNKLNTLYILKLSNETTKKHKQAILQRITLSVLTNLTPGSINNERIQLKQFVRAKFNDINQERPPLR